MAVNKLQLNDDKTEFLVICVPWYRDTLVFDNLTVGSSQVAAGASARNLGVLMDNALNMDAHI